MFYNHFIATLYHFLGLTYWHSAHCQLLFLLVFYITDNQYQMESKRSETFCRFFWTRRHPVGKRSKEEGAQGEHKTPVRAWRVVPTSVASRTTSSPNKSPNIQEKLGEPTKHNSSRRKFQNHEIQSRVLFRHSVGGDHDHGGVHHPHWCSSDDAWVVHHRPAGP